MNSDDLGKKGARGAVLMLSSQWLKFAIQAALIILLSRLLTPGDFGVVAVAISVSGLVTLIGDFGLSYAILQKRDLSRQQHSNAFWISFLFGALLAGLLYSASPLIGNFFQSEQTMLALKALSITAVIYAIGNQYRTVAGKGLNFRLLAVADLSAQITASGVAIFMAFSGFGFWTLVAQQIVLATVPPVLLMVGTRWFPLLPRRAPMRDILSFGLHSTGIQLLNYASDNADTVVLGRTASAAVVGSYSRAYQLVLLPLQQIASPLQRVALPVLNRVDTQSRFNDALVAIQRGLGYFLGAVYAAVAVFAETIVLTVLGPQWTETVTLFRILALIGVMHALGLTYGWLYILRNRVALQFRIVLFTQPAIIVLAVVGSNWGAIGVAVAMTTGTLLDWMVHTLVGLPRLEISVRSVLSAGLRPVAIYVTIAAVAILAQYTLLEELDMWTRAAISLGICLLSSATVLVISRTVRDDLRQLMVLARLLRR